MSRPGLRPCVLHAALLLAIAAPDGRADARQLRPEQALDVAAVAAARIDPHLLVLQSGAFDPLHERLAFSRDWAEATDARYGIVQFDAAQAAATRIALAAQGVAIVGHLPNHAFQVRWPPAGRSAVTGIASIRWSGDYPLGLKLSPSLRELETGAAAEPVRLDVHGFRGESFGRLADALLAAMPDVRIDAGADTLDLPAFSATVPRGRLDALLRAAARIDGVAWIAPHRPAVLDNLDSVGAIQSATPSCEAFDSYGFCQDGYTLRPQTAPLWSQGLLGSGQIVAIADTGLDRNEEWFTGLDRGTGVVQAITDADDPSPLPPAIGQVWPDRKVYAYWVQPGATAYDNAASCAGSSATFHGTHVSGSVAGDAAPFSTPTDVHYVHHKGMAPNAQVLFQDIGDDVSGCLRIPDPAALLLQARSGGAGIHNSSWGARVSGVYSSHDQRFDAALWSLEDLLAVVSAGNAGPSSRTVGSPASGKNVLTVGATTHGHLDTIAEWSSRGPTADGRRKPDLVAPGIVFSAFGNTDDGPSVQPPMTQLMGGTSMASPTLAGGAALLRQYFEDGWYPLGRALPGERLEPSGALMKAALINGGRPTTPSWPNANEGWGRIQLDRSAYFQGAPRGVRHWVRDHAAGLAGGESDVFEIRVEAGEELRVTLAWFDPEAALAAVPTLVNDLDLIVVAPDGTRYLGNVYWNGESAGGGVADRINTVEQVRRRAPVAGVYTLHVEAAAVPGNGRDGSERQGYAVVAAARMGVLGDRLFADGFRDDPRAAPTTAVTLAANDAQGARVQWQPVAGAQGYQVYRAAGTCTEAAPQRFRFVGQSVGTELTDARGSGGSTYAWRVRALRDGVEGPLSTACADGVSALP